MQGHFNYLRPILTVFPISNDEWKIPTSFLIWVAECSDPWNGCSNEIFVTSNYVLAANTSPIGCLTRCLESVQDL